MPKRFLVYVIEFDHDEDAETFDKKVDTENGAVIFEHEDAGDRVTVSFEKESVRSELPAELSILRVHPSLLLHGGLMDFAADAMDDGEDE